MLKTATLLFLLLISVAAKAQLGFCQGSKGNPVFYENFGSGDNFGPELSVGTTTYQYVSGAPDDGQYTLSNKINLLGSWHTAEDHTFNEAENGVNGYALVVNASLNPGEFYSRTVTGLCVNTTFEFSAYVMNIYNAGSNACSDNGIPINVTFEIWNLAGTVLLKSGSSGPIVGTSNPNWNQYALTFTTATETAVTLKMRNNGSGGCGNDLAIDDIAFRSCGDFAKISSSGISGDRLLVCESETPVNLPMNIAITGNNATAFQWQKSFDGSVWTDIAGANTLNYHAIAVTETTLFRAKIAQDASNISNPFCFTIAETFTIIVVPQPQAPLDNEIVVCASDGIPILSIANNPDLSYNWYDSATGGNLLSAASSSYLPSQAGIFWVESFVPGTDCASVTRGMYSLQINESPTSFEESLSFCEGNEQILTALPALQYLWSNGETGNFITAVDGGNYTVTITNEFGCSGIGNFIVTKYLPASVPTFSINDDSVTFINSGEGNYEYSIDGGIFQLSPIFNEITGGRHLGTIREIHGCGEESAAFFVVAFPKFFTPNGDGYNDYFSIKDFSFLKNPIIDIFDRYGTLLKQLNNTNPSWDGKFKGNEMPSSDYWYRMTYDDGKPLRGHFSLKR